jgi:lipid-binding SYLF domain-containing protein
MPRFPERILFPVVLLLFSFAFLPGSLVAGDREDALDILNKTSATLQHFLDDPEMTWFRNNLGEARGIVIFPRVVKAGFVLGGSGGQGALVARDKDTNEWLGPVFYTMGSASVGFQAGVDVAEMILLIMTDKGADALLASTVKLGADARVAAGPVGAGVAAATADVYGFSRSKGLFAGVALDGSVISPSGKLNSALYAADVSPSDVLIRREASSADGAALLQAVAAAAH